MIPLLLEGLPTFMTAFLVGIIVSAVIVLPLYGGAKQVETPPIHGVA